VRHRAGLVQNQANGAYGDNGRGSESLGYGLGLGGSVKRTGLVFCVVLARPVRIDVAGDADCALDLSEAFAYSCGSDHYEHASDTNVE
jgi:hypothetical protein